MDRDSIVSQLPALLRYARSLTRSNQEGEALVEAVLKSLLNGKAVLESSLSLRSALLAQVHQHWIPLDGVPSAPVDRDNPLFSALAHVPVADRAGLLLVRFEGLSSTETARVTGLSEAEVARRLVSAEQRLFRQSRPRVLIISDQPTDGLDLDELLTELGCEVIGPVGLADATAAAESELPNLILTNVARHNLTSGVAAAAEAAGRSRDVPVILLTSASSPIAEHRSLRPNVTVHAPFDRKVCIALINRALGRT